MTRTTIETSDNFLTLGDTRVLLRLHSHRTRPDGPVVLSVHDDENTSVAAALSVMETRGGRLLELVHQGSRRVHFRLDEQGYYSIDPNRMFSPFGRRDSLRSESGGAVPDEALRAAAAFADSLVRFYLGLRADCVVTVHNNTDGNYSLISYLPGRRLEDDAKRVHRGPGDADNFYFVTEDADYEALAQGDENTVQQRRGVGDDGSLSVYCDRQGIRYLNVEAQHGAYDVQREMIGRVYDLVR